MQTYKHTDVFQSQIQVLLLDIIHISHKVSAIWFAVPFNEIYFYKSQIILEKCFGKQERFFNSGI